MQRYEKIKEIINREKTLTTTVYHSTQKQKISWWQHALNTYQIDSPGS